MKRRVKLGQHFLIDQDILAEIIKVAQVKKSEEILEIGPGRGALTKALLETGAKVTAVEIDERLIKKFKEELKENKNLKIIQADILKFPLKADQLRVDKIIANLPYQITSPVIRKFLENQELKPKIMVLMVQREVAERICAKPGDSNRGFLSVLTQYYSRPEIIKLVPRESFRPVPRVESAILKITVKGKQLKASNNLFRVIQAGFSQKRKKIRNSLSAGLGFKPRQIDLLLKKAGIKSNLRAEDLSIKQWEKASSTLLLPLSATSRISR